MSTTNDIKISALKPYRETDNRDFPFDDDVRFVASFNDLNSENPKWRTFAVEAQDIRNYVAKNLFAIVDELPSSKDADKSKIYILKKEDGSYEFYVYEEGADGEEGEFKSVGANVDDIVKKVIEEITSGEFGGSSETVERLEEQLAESSQKLYVLEEKLALYDKRFGYTGSEVWETSFLTLDNGFSDGVTSIPDKFTEEVYFADDITLESTKPTVQITSEDLTSETTTLNLGSHKLSNVTDAKDWTEWKYSNGSANTLDIKTAKVTVNGGEIDSTKFGILADTGSEVIVNGVTMKSALYNISANKDSKVTINGGEFCGHVTCIQSNGGEIIINGGTFYALNDNENKETDHRLFTLNIIDSLLAGHTDVKDFIKVTGGIFIGFNPATDSPEVGMEDNSFVADGYKSVKIGPDMWQVVKA